MGMNEYRDFNETFLSLAKNARAVGNCRSKQLGDVVLSVVHKAMNYRADADHDFLGYSEDLKLDMIGNATFAVYNAIMTTADFSDASRLFNYAYTTALNSIRATLSQFYRNMYTVSLNEGVIPRTEIARRMVVDMRGLVRRNEAMVNRVAQTRKIVRLRKVIRLAVDDFIRHMNRRKLKQLINHARKIREGATC